MSRVRMAGFDTEPAETPEIGGECLECRAPTERIRVVHAWSNPPNAHAVALGSLGGRRGGPARAARLSAERRSEIARAAAMARWAQYQ